MNYPRDHPIRVRYSLSMNTNEQSKLRDAERNRLMAFLDWLSRNQVYLYDGKTGMWAPGDFPFSELVDDYTSSASIDPIGAMERAAGYAPLCERMEPRETD
jgi:hypothetical protein